MAGLASKLAKPGGNLPSSAPVAAATSGTAAGGGAAGVMPRALSPPPQNAVRRLPRVSYVLLKRCVSHTEHGEHIERTGTEGRIAVAHSSASTGRWVRCVCDCR
jgi:hypothetical protein